MSIRGFIAVGNDLLQLASLGFQYANMILPDTAQPQITSVQLVVASDNEADLGGTFPSIAIWNNDGQRIGQSKDIPNVAEGGDHTATIKHTQDHETDEAASYIMLSNNNNNAICIAAIYVTDQFTGTTWYGDYGWKCGMSWHLNANEIGSEKATPKCVWLDGDGSSGINAKAMSMHLEDMTANPDRLTQYEDPDLLDTMCGSTPRFSFWGNLLPDSEIPFFDPPLVYNVDSENGGIGNDTDLTRIIDKPNEFDKSVTMYLGGNRKRNGGSVLASSSISRDPRGIKKRSLQADQLIVTSIQSHSARELCESTTSWGPDTVSTHENLFCDMYSGTKTLYPLCNATVTAACFDLTNTTLILQNGTEIDEGSNIATRDAFGWKGYNRTIYW